MALNPPPALQVDGGRLGDGGLATLQLLLRKLQLRLDLNRWAERAQLADQAQDLVAIAHTLWIPSSYQATLLSWRRHVQRLRCDKLRHALYHWTARAQLEKDSQELVAMAYTLWIPSSCLAALLSWRRHIQRLRCDMLRVGLHRWTERMRLTEKAQYLVARANAFHCDKLRARLQLWTARMQFAKKAQFHVAKASAFWISSGCRAVLRWWRRHVLWPRLDDGRILRRLRHKELKKIMDSLRLNCRRKVRVVRSAQSRIWLAWRHRMLQQQLLRWVSFVQGRRMHILALIAYSRFALGITRRAMLTWRSHALGAVQLDVLFLRGQYRLELISLAWVLLKWARSREWDEMYKYTPLQLGRAHLMKGGVREWYAFAEQTRRLASWMHRAQQHAHSAALREALKRWAIDEVLPERNAAVRRQKLTKHHLMRAAVVRWQERILTLRLIPVADGRLRKRNMASRWNQWTTCVCLSRVRKELVTASASQRRHVACTLALITWVRVCEFALVRQGAVSSLNQLRQRIVLHSWAKLLSIDRVPPSELRLEAWSSLWAERSSFKRWVSRRRDLFRLQCNIYRIECDHKRYDQATCFLKWVEAISRSAATMSLFASWFFLVEQHKLTSAFGAWARNATGIHVVKRAARRLSNAASIVLFRQWASLTADMNTAFHLRACAEQLLRYSSLVAKFKIWCDTVSDQAQRTISSHRLLLRKVGEFFLKWGSMTKTSNRIFPLLERTMRLLLLHEAGASFTKWHEAISARLVFEKALMRYRCSARKAALHCWASMTDALQEAVPKLFRALQLENHTRGPAFTGLHGDVRTPAHLLAYLEQLKNAATLSLACKRWVRAASKRKLDEYESRRASNAVQRSAVSQWARAARHTEAVVQRLLHAEKTGQRHSMLVSLRNWRKVSAARQMVHISARRISFASRRVAFDKLSEAASNRGYMATCTKRAVEHARRTAQAAVLSRWRWDNVDDIMLHFIGGHMSLLALPRAFRMWRTHASRKRTVAERAALSSTRTLRRLLISWAKWSAARHRAWSCLIIPEAEFHAKSKLHRSRQAWDDWTALAVQRMQSTANLLNASRHFDSNSFRISVLRHGFARMLLAFYLRKQASVRHTQLHLAIRVWRATVFHEEVTLHALRDCSVRVDEMMTQRLSARYFSIWKFILREHSICIDADSCGDTKSKGTALGAWREQAHMQQKAFELVTVAISVTKALSFLRWMRWAIESSDYVVLRSKGAAHAHWLAVRNLRASMVAWYRWMEHERHGTAIIRLRTVASVDMYRLRDAETAFALWNLRRCSRHHMTTEPSRFLFSHTLRKWRKVSSRRSTLQLMYIRAVCIWRSNVRLGALRRWIQANRSTPSLTFIAAIVHLRFNQSAQLAAFRQWVREDRLRRHSQGASTQVLRRLKASAFCCWLLRDRRKITYRAISWSTIKAKEAALCIWIEVTTTQRVFRLCNYSRLQAGLRGWLRNQLWEHSYRTMMAQGHIHHMHFERVSALKKWVCATRIASLMLRAKLALSHGEKHASFYTWLEAVTAARLRAPAVLYAKQLMRHSALAAYYTKLAHMAARQAHMDSLVAHLVRDRRVEIFQKWADFASSVRGIQQLLHLAVPHAVDKALADATRVWEVQSAALHQLRRAKELGRHIIQRASIYHWVIVMTDFVALRSVTLDVVHRRRHRQALAALRLWEQLRTEGRNIQRAVLRECHGALNGAFSSWTRDVDYIYHVRALLIRAVEQSKHNSEQSALRRWVKIVNVERQLQNSECQAKASVKRRFFRSMRAMSLRAKRRISYFERAQLLTRSVALCLARKKWLQWAAKRTLTKYAKKHAHHTTQKVALGKWMGAVQDALMMQRLLLAVEIEQQRLIAPVFYRWRTLKSISLMLMRAAHRGRHATLEMSLRRWSDSSSHAAARERQQLRAEELRKQRAASVSVRKWHGATRADNIIYRATRALLHLALSSAFCHWVDLNVELAAALPHLLRAAQLRRHSAVVTGFRKIYQAGAVRQMLDYSEQFMCEGVQKAAFFSWVCRFRAATKSSLNVSVFVRLKEQSRVRTSFRSMLELLFVQQSTRDIARRTSRTSMRVALQSWLEFAGLYLRQAVLRFSVDSTCRALLYAFQTLIEVTRESGTRTNLLSTCARDRQRGNMLLAVARWRAVSAARQFFVRSRVAALEQMMRSSFRRWIAQNISASLEQDQILQCRLQLQLIFFGAWQHFAVVRLANLAKLATACVNRWRRAYECSLRTWRSACSRSFGAGVQVVKAVIAIREKMQAVAFSRWVELHRNLGHLFYVNAAYQRMRLTVSVLRWRHFTRDHRRTLLALGHHFRLAALRFVELLHVQQSKSAMLDSLLKAITVFRMRSAYRIWQVRSVRCGHFLDVYHTKGVLARRLREWQVRARLSHHVDAAAHESLVRRTPEMFCRWQHRARLEALVQLLQERGRLNVCAAFLQLWRARLKLAAARSWRRNRAAHHERKNNLLKLYEHVDVLYEQRRACAELWDRARFHLCSILLRSVQSQLTLLQSAIWLRRSRYSSHLALTLLHFHRSWAYNLQLRLTAPNAKVPNQFIALCMTHQALTFLALLQRMRLERFACFSAQLFLSFGRWKRRIVLQRSFASFVDKANWQSKYAESTLPKSTVPHPRPCDGRDVSSRSYLNTEVNVVHLRVINHREQVYQPVQGKKPYNLHSSTAPLLSLLDSGF